MLLYPTLASLNVVADLAEVAVAPTAAVSQGVSAAVLFQEVAFAEEAASVLVRLVESASAYRAVGTADQEPIVAPTKIGCSEARGVWHHWV